VWWLFPQWNHSLWEPWVHCQLLWQPKLLPGGGGSVALFVGMTRSESLSPQAMIEDFLNEFYMPSTGGGALASPYPRGSAQGHHLLSPQPHDGQKMLWPLRPWWRFYRRPLHLGRTLDPFLSHSTPFGRGNKRYTMLSIGLLSVRQCSDEVSSLASKQSPQPSRSSRHNVRPCSRRWGS
jgi:hypothetical protein